MPKRPKTGPPYTDIPSEIYVVVTNPFGMCPNPRSRNQNDFDRVASWAQFVLQKAGLGGERTAAIECIYSMGTRDEVILQFREGTDIIPLLGEHRWANIAKDGKAPPSGSTSVFIYNWRDNGDPANHNWTENFPHPLPLNTVPVKSPYPVPSWTRPPSTLANFVHSIPPPPVPPPVPNPEYHPDPQQQPTAPPPSSPVTPSPTPPEPQDQLDSGEQSVAQDSASTDLFRPYEPPLQHPSHGQFLSQRQTQPDEAPSRASPPAQKLVKKLDPYELEEEAFNVLRSPDPVQENTEDVKAEDIKPIIPLSVKLEPCEVKLEDDNTQYNINLGSNSGYQPSKALVDAFNSLTRSEQIPSSTHPQTRDPRKRSDASPQATFPASSAYRPSAELKAEINDFLLGAAAAASSSSSTNNARPRAVMIKREYEEEVAKSLGEKKRIKIEEC